MDTRRILDLALILCALAAFAVPVSGLAAEETKDYSLYFRPAVRFGTDDRTLFIMDFLVPVYRGDKDILFLNAKFTPDTEDAWEVNAGIGYRRMLSDRLVLGGNLFYDHRLTRYDSHFDQVGVGLEAMAEVNGVGLTGRLNYYQPLNEARLGSDFGYVFYGNGIYTAGIEEPMNGFDYEAGVRVPFVSDYVETWAYGGGYHFFGRHVPDVNGFSARIEAMPTDFVRLNFEYRNDTINHGEYYGEVALEIPFSVTNLVAGKDPFGGIGDVLTGSRTLPERMVEPVRRDIDIVVRTDYLSGADAASAEGRPAVGVIFVADNAVPGGDGSFEHPYNAMNLAAADPRLGDTVSIVHVLPGDGSGMGAGGSFLFEKPGITIWGAGAANPAYPNVVNFVQGYPALHSGLFLGAPNMTVLGLCFDEDDDGTTYPIGITIGSSTSGAGVSIFSNVINHAMIYGIVCTAAGDLGAPGAPVAIWDNTITSVRSNFFNTAGIYLSSSFGNIYADVHDNRIEDVWNGAFAYGIFVEAAEGDFTGSIRENSVATIFSFVNTAGICAYAGDDFNGSISANTVSDIKAFRSTTDIYSYGIYAEAGNSFYGSIINNDINDIESGNSHWAEAYGIFAGAEGGTFAGAINSNTIRGLRADDTWYGSIAAGIYAHANEGLTGAVSGNTILDISSGSRSDAVTYGIALDTETSIMTSVTGNLVRVTGGTDAFGLFASGVSLGTASSPMVISGNSGSVEAPAAYMAYLYAGHPGSSYVLIGRNDSANTFTTTGTWAGNYPHPGGPIWATDNGSFIH